MSLDLRIRASQILVLREQDAFFSECGAEHFRVDGALLELTDRDDIASVGPQAADDRKIAAFIREKTYSETHHEAIATMLSWAIESAAKSSAALTSSTLSFG